MMRLAMVLMRQTLRFGQRTLPWQRQATSLLILMFGIPSPAVIVLVVESGLTMPLYGPLLMEGRR
jgi:hypothetical protein